LIANVYNLQVMNMTEKPRRFALSASGLDGVKITPAEPFEVDAAGLKSVTVEVAVRRSRASLVPTRCISRSRRSTTRRSLFVKKLHSSFHDRDLSP
jgi:polyferredoxin